MSPGFTYRRGRLISTLNFIHTMLPSFSLGVSPEWLISESVIQRRPFPSGASRASLTPPRIARRCRIRPKHDVEPRGLGPIVATVRYEAEFAR